MGYRPVLRNTAVKTTHNRKIKRRVGLRMVRSDSNNAFLNSYFPQHLYTIA